MLGENLRDLRTKKDLTQQQVADLLNINRVTYTQYELNKRDPDTATLIRLADFFGVTTDELLGRRLLKGQIISEDHPDPEVAQLLRDNGVEKLKLARDVTLDELERAIKVIKALRDEKKQDSSMP